MSKNLKIFCLKSFLNTIALCVFLIGNYHSNTIFIIIGGASMIIVSFILYRQFLNPLIAIVLGIFLTIVISPWYFGVFWAVSIFIMFQIITLLHNLFTKPNFLKTRFKSN